MTLALLRDHLFDAFTYRGRDDQVAKTNVRKGGDDEVSEIPSRLSNRRDVGGGDGLAPSVVDELLQLACRLVLALPSSACRNLERDSVELNVVAGRVATN